MLLAILFIACAVAQVPRARIPQGGERRDILTAARKPIEKELKQKVLFVLNSVKVSGNFAFYSGRLQNAAGK